MAPKSGRTVLVVVALVTIVIITAVSVNAIQKARTTGTEVILHAGYTIHYGTTGSGWGIGTGYSFTARKVSILTGSWDSDGLVKVVVLNNTELKQKDLNGSANEPFSYTGALNMTLQPGNYQLVFLSSGSENLSKGYISITTPIELSQVGS